MSWFKTPLRYNTDFFFFLIGSWGTWRMLKNVETAGLSTQTVGSPQLRTARSQSCVAANWEMRRWCSSTRKVQVLKASFFVRILSVGKSTNPNLPLLVPLGKVSTCRGLSFGPEQPLLLQGCAPAVGGSTACPTQGGSFLHQKLTSSRPVITSFFKRTTRATKRHPVWEA